MQTEAKNANNYFTRCAPRFNLTNHLLQKYCVPGGKLIDVGCGDGATTLVFTEGIPMNICGIDLDEEVVKIANKFFPCQQCDAGRERFPYDDCSFDIVHAGAVIEHIEDTDFFISECWRVLKNEGIVILSTPNLASWVNRILLLFGYQLFDVEVSKHECFGLPKSSKRKWKPVGHVRCFTLRALKRFLIFHKFEILEIKGISSNVPIWVTKILDRICNRFLPSLSRVLLVVAKKTHGHK